MSSHAPGRDEPRRKVTPRRVTVRELERRVAAFCAERHPYALPRVVVALDRLLTGAPSRLDADAIERIRAEAAGQLETELVTAPPRRTPEVTPGVTATVRLRQAARALAAEIDGCLRREALKLSLPADERRSILEGMCRTRATDMRLKSLFTTGEMKFEGRPFQGKGFRSLGQEAIYAVASGLKRGDRFRRPDGSWSGDVVSPLIRDLGCALAMGLPIDNVLNGQIGKSGPPMQGRDLHYGDLDYGVLAPAAPLAIAAANVAGFAAAFAREGSERVALAFIGEGGTSLGEWHEAINACAARRWPAVFCIQNNQTALGTPVHDQAAVRTFADKAVGYGVPGVTVDGTDPDAVAAAFTWAAERARRGEGVTLIELQAMRICGHAHHDDMLYLGHDPDPSWDYPEPQDKGYIDRDRFAFWRDRDPIPTYAARLEAEGVIEAGELDVFQRTAEREVAEAAAAIAERPWPEPESAGRGVYALGGVVERIEPLSDLPGPLPRRDVEVEPAPAFERGGTTFLEAIALGVGECLGADPRVFVYGEDCGAPYGNAFMLLRSLLDEHSDRILNAPIAEAGIIGVCVGAALAGQRPIGEIQFNDFVAGGFNQLVNNAAKTHYRTGRSVPMVLRMPWGGLRSAGPYHSQNTEPWFVRTPGLKIVVPSTPHDARALLHSAVDDPDPVLYYEHIALYRDPKLRQKLPETAPGIPLGRAAVRRAGDDLLVVSYGAYVHRALAAAERLADEHGIECEVIDLRTLVPLDEETLFDAVRRHGKVLICQEDTVTGSVGQWLAALVQERLFECLDAPVRVLGSLDTPVPYSPPLERRFLVQVDEIVEAGRILAAY